MLPCGVFTQEVPTFHPSLKIERYHSAITSMMAMSYALPHISVRKRSMTLFGRCLKKRGKADALYSNARW